jgi:hypothetical protein
MNDLIREAIAWAEKGIPVFPCNANKQPLTTNGFYDAVTEPSKVKALFEFYGNAAVMIGGRMGDGLFAVDVDLYKGEEVKAWYKARVDDGDLIETRTHTTKSGGVHLLYEAEEAPTCVPVKGVEVKGEGSYIILPGTPGYTVIKEGISRAPASLLEILRLAASNTRGSTLAQLEANVLAGSDFHNSLTQIAAKLAARGEDQVSIQRRLLELLENSVAKHPGNDRHARWRGVVEDRGGELSRIASSAYRKFNDDALIEEAGEVAGGAAHDDYDRFTEVWEKTFTQLGNFEPKAEDLTPEPKYDEDVWPFDGEGYFADEDHPITDANFVLYPIFAEGETVVLFAEPKTGKTAVALTTALHIACGMDLGHFKVASPGPCLYYALEGSRAIRLRVASWKKVMHERGIQLPERIPLFVVEKPANLLKEKVREESAAQIIAADKYARKFGEPIKAIYIDTLTKAMSGGDQNSVEDTSSLFDIVNLIRAGGVTATIIFVHHKARQGHVRGSSNIEAEPDMLLDVSKQNEVVSLKVARARSIEDGMSYHFLVSDVDLGKNKQGHQIHGMFVEPLVGDTDEQRMEDPALVQLVAQRRKALTELGEEVSAREAIDAWLHQGLIKGKKVRGMEVAPALDSAEAQEALHKVANDVGGSIYGDFIIRPVTQERQVVGFKIAKAGF